MYKKIYLCIAEIIEKCRLEYGQIISTAVSNCGPGTGIIPQLNYWKSIELERK